MYMLNKILASEVRGLSDPSQRKVWESFIKAATYPLDKTALSLTLSQGKKITGIKQYIGKPLLQLLLERPDLYLTIRNRFSAKHFMRTEMNYLLELLCTIPPRRVPEKGEKVVSVSHAPQDLLFGELQKENPGQLDHYVNGNRHYIFIKGKLSPAAFVLLQRCFFGQEDRENIKAVYQRPLVSKEYERGFIFYYRYDGTDGRLVQEITLDPDMCGEFRERHGVFGAINVPYFCEVLFAKMDAARMRAVLARYWEEDVLARSVKQEDDRQLLMPF